jgi:hypothetical protein
VTGKPLTDSPLWILPKDFDGEKDSRQTLADAKGLAKKGDLAGVEQKLVALNLSKPGTSDWHMETTQRLMQTAGDLVREGSPKQVNAIVSQSLQHLDQAANLAKAAKDVRGQANAKVMTGFIQERFSGDAASAIASYQAALQLVPDDKATLEALDRLQKADANLRAKIHPVKK